MTKSTKLERSSNKMIAGVCQGIADYTGIDVLIVRIITAVLCLWSGIGVAIYGALWLLLPEAGTGRTGFEIVKGEAEKYTKKSSSQQSNYQNYDQR